MHIFVTGASGWVGSAVVQELIAHGHKVTGVIRSKTAEAALKAAGAQVFHGSLEDPVGLANAVGNADGVIHTAFNHDFSKFAENSEQDRRAIIAMGEVLKGSQRPLIVTSGMLHLARGKVATEQAAFSPPSAAMPRASEAAAQTLVAQGVRASSVRLPPSVHGPGDHGFLAILIQIARQQGASAYIGEGQNRWPGVNRLDAAQVYRLAIERGGQGGPFHAVAEEGIYFKDIADIIARRLNLPLVSKPASEAGGHFGWFAAIAGADCPASSQHTRALLGWQPSQPGLLADLDQRAYFSP